MKISTVKIIDSRGKVIQTINQLFNNQINIKDLVAGIYLIQTHTDQGEVRTTKFMKL